jgi:ABC-type transport system involved in cytochrome c biogenesis permease subunit
MQRSLTILCTLCLALAGSLARADEVNLDVWRSIPVFEAKNNSGRVEPLDSFARQAVDDICQIAKGKMTISLADYADQGEDLAKSEYKAALPLMAGAKERKLTPSEMLLSWMAEPDKWEVVPFIYAAHKDVREVIGVPELNDRGLHLKYVSPKQVFESESLREYLRDLHERENQPGFKPDATDQLVYEVLNRYQRWRAITLDPSRPLTAGLLSPPGARREFLSQLNKIIELVETPNADRKTFASLLNVLATLPAAPSGEKNGELTLPQAAQNTTVGFAKVLDVGQTLFGQWQTDVKGAIDPGDFSENLSLAQAVEAVTLFRQNVAQLEAALARHRDRLFNDASPEERQTLGPLFREMADKARDLHLRAIELNIALYEDGNCLRVVPALNAGALSKKRDPNVKSQPWYSLAAVLNSEELMDGYPTSKVKAVRNAWKELKAAYVDRENSRRAEEVASAQQALYDALKDLGNAVEPMREDLVAQKLAVDERDAAIMAYTRWPDAHGLNRIGAELKYNRIDPFGKSWVISLAALACFALSFGVMRRPMFIAGVAVLCFGVIWTAYGFYLRVYVTQWAPVTNMYETVVWVAFSVAVLGAWFLLLPLLWPGLKDAWRATALPFSFEATELDSFQKEKLTPGGWLVLNVVTSVARIALMGWVFYALTIDTRYSDGQRPIFALLPNLTDVGGNAGQMVQQVIVWAVGFLCMLLSVWFAPRLTLAGLASLVFVPWDLLKRRGVELNKLGYEVHSRWPIAIGATLMSAFGAWVAWMAPSVLDESFSPLQPVLRSNFWLTVHVLTIVSSYAAGMLALGIGLIALMYYIFGTYRDPVALKVGEGFRPAGHDADEYARSQRRPPEQVGSLAQYAYRAIQVAVLLLAVGTILGGIWADRSWGRFWGWDPKEVWALVSLLVYLAILHGRFAGWFNNFGLIFGTVIGATAIVMSWYGVNFVLPKLAPDGVVGLHSYGSGAGGLPQVMSFIVALWLLQAAATIAYLREMSRPVKPVTESGKPLTLDELAKTHASSQRWSTPAGKVLAAGSIGVFAMVTLAYLLILVYGSGYSVRGAVSMVLPIPALGVLLYVIAVGILNGLGIETSQASEEAEEEAKEDDRKPVNV